MALSVVVAVGLVVIPDDWACGVTIPVVSF